MLENAYFEARIHPIAFGGRAPPWSAGGAYSAPQTPSCMKGGEWQGMGKKKRGKEKEPQEAKRKKKAREKKGNLGRN